MNDKKYKEFDRKWTLLANIVTIIGMILILIGFIYAVAVGVKGSREYEKYMTQEVYGEKI